MKYNVKVYFQFFAHELKDLTLKQFKEMKTCFDQGERYEHQESETSLMIIDFHTAVCLEIEDGTCEEEKKEVKPKKAGKK